MIFQLLWKKWKIELAEPCTDRFPANTSVICIKFSVIETAKFLCSSFENTLIFVLLAYSSNSVFANSLISVVISFAVLTLYQGKFA